MINMSLTLNHESFKDPSLEEKPETETEAEA